MSAQTPREQPRFVNAYLSDESHIMALYRDGAGGLHRKSVDAEWVSYHRADEMPADLLRDLKATPFVRGVKVEGEWLRVSWAGRNVRHNILFDPNSPLVQAGVAHYEGDVHPVTRWLTDARPPLGKPRRVFLDIETDSHVSFANKEQMRVLCWSLYDEDCNEVASGMLDEDTDKDEARLLREYIEAIKPFDQVVCWNGSFNRKEGPFDFYVMNSRIRQRFIPFNRRDWTWIDYAPLYKRQNMHSAESGELKQSFKLGDICNEELREGKEEVPKFVLDHFGAERCKNGLGPLSRDLWDLGGDFRAMLLTYCKKDSRLIPQLDKKKGYIALVQATCDVCSLIFEQRSLFPSVHGDGFMLRHGLERGYHFPTKVYVDPDDEDVDQSQFDGAYNMAPKVIGTKKWSEEQARKWRAERGMTDGILRNVHVFDFSRMYPSIIISWNMSVDTLAPEVPVNGPVPPGRARCPLTGTAFRTDREGILVAAVKAMLAQREACDNAKSQLGAGTPEWQAMDALSQAWKVLANEFFGITGSKTGRFYERRVAEGITKNGEWLIKHTLAEAERRGWHPMYSDTDSGFVVGPTRQEFRAFTDWCNAELYPPLLKSAGCVSNSVKVAYEKEFLRLIFTAGKRYTGDFRHYKWMTTCSCDEYVRKDGTRGPGRLDVRKMACQDCKRTFTEETLPPPRGKPEVKGIELKRGDSPRLVRDLQKRLIDMLVGGMGTGAERTDRLEDFHALLARTRTHVLTGNLTREEIAISKGVKKTSDYKPLKQKKNGEMSLPAAQVQVANMLRARGEHVGEGAHVEYFVADGSVSPQKVLPLADYDGTNLDRYDFWEDSVFPPLLRILHSAFPDHDWSPWARVRPPKPRGRSRALPGQLGLALPEGDTRVSLAAPAFLAPAPAKRPERMVERDARELRVAYTGQDCDEVLLGLQCALKAHAGSDAIVVVIREEETSRVFWESTYRVDFAALADDARVRALVHVAHARFAA